VSRFVPLAATLVFGATAVVLVSVAGGDTGGRARSPGVPVGPTRPALQDYRRPGRAFYFTRAIYSGYGRRFRSWGTDWPKADIQFLVGVRRLTNIDAFELDNPVRLDDPELRRYPFLYALEVGYMALTEPEVQGLRDYLLAGGFLVIDDFWGSSEWANFEHEIGRVLPEYPVVDIPSDHPILGTFYQIEEILQVPNVGLGRMGGRTWERDGYEPALKGIFDDRGRLLVVINWNTDLGDAWEWAENPWYPIHFSNFALKLGVNMIVYGMSH
jgi:hypothetical protein